MSLLSQVSAAGRYYYPDAIEESCRSHPEPASTASKQRHTHEDANAGIGWLEPRTQPQPQQRFFKQGSRMLWVASGRRSSAPWLDMLPFYRLPTSPTAFFVLCRWTWTTSALLLLSRLAYMHFYLLVCPDSVDSRV